MKHVVKAVTSYSSTAGKKVVGRSSRNWRESQRLGCPGQLRASLGSFEKQARPSASVQVINGNVDSPQPRTKLQTKPFTHWPAVLIATLLILSAAVLNPGLAQAAAEATTEHVGFGKRIAATLRSANWPDEAILFVISMLPVVELRGAIPVGHWMGLPPLYTYALSVAGNMVPVPFVLKYMGSVSSYLIARSEGAKKFFDWLFARTRSKADLLVKYRTLGLILFVAVPLPLTGAWSGAIGAYLLDLPFWESIFANLVGVMGAGLIMTVLCQMGWLGAVIAGVAVFAVASGAFLEAVRKPPS